jgi:hypothetical protein
MGREGVEPERCCRRQILSYNMRAGAMAESADATDLKSFGYWGNDLRYFLALFLTGCDDNLLVIIDKLESIT